MSLFQSEYELMISFEDLDPMNVVWHGNYLRYMEQARFNMFNKLGYSYQDFGTDNYAYPVAKMNIKYIKPAKLGDVLTVKTEIISAEPTLDIKYVIYNKKTQDKILEASTMQIAINTDTKESKYYAPERLKQKLGLNDG